MKPILLMPEAGDYFFWEPNTKENGYLPTLGSIDSLELSLPLWLEVILKIWNDRYPIWYITQNGNPFEEFNKTGLILYKQVRLSLTDYYVVYYDQILKKVIDKN